MSIAPDHKAIYFYLSFPVAILRGPGFWKFNNTLLDDEVHIAHIRELIPQIHEKYSFVQDQQLLWELMKMEIREKSISFAKQKSRVLSKRETEICRRLDHLGNLICNGNNLLNINLLLTEREGRTGEYWPEVVAVRTERSEVRTKTTEGQYSPVRLEQARLVSSLLYGTRVMLVSKLPAFENKKYTSYDHFHGNGPYGKIPTKKEPIRTPGFTPRLPCHIVIIHLKMSTKL